MVEIFLLLLIYRIRYSFTIKQMKIGKHGQEPPTAMFF